MAPGKQRGAPSPARPKASALCRGCESAHIPIGARSEKCAPTPKMLVDAPPSETVSYARWTPSMPNPRFAPKVTPKADSVSPEAANQRFVNETYGSMLMPGVGSPALTPAPAMMLVDEGLVEMPVPDSALCAAPAIRLIATGIRLPP